MDVVLPLLTSMTGRLKGSEKDGKNCCQQASTATHHQRNWKVMLWLATLLLMLVEDVFCESSEERRAELLRPGRPLSWHPARPPTAPRLPGGVDIREPWTAGFDERPPLEGEEEGDRPSRWRRSTATEPTSQRTSRRRKERKKMVSSRDCRMEKKQMRVRDLGLGFDSDEIILFKYCVGTCHAARKNYDLALKALVDNSVISSSKVSSHPCCRPTRYETVSFMDARTVWQTIKWLSAANCSCVG